MIITVASGKGGTGKTTVAVNMALSSREAVLLDCDVEEPNAHTLLKIGNETITSVLVPVPVVDPDLCTLCGKCADFCEFNALFVGKEEVLVYKEMCHSCGGCALVCPEGAISEKDREIGETRAATTDGIKLVYGELNVGEPISIPLIKAVKRNIDEQKLNILDAPPGTSCSLIETVEDSDYVIMVTEPTPFGLHDLEMAIDTVDAVGTPYGVIINRYGIGDEKVEEFLDERGVELLMKIPFDRKIAELYSRGIPFVNELEEYRSAFVDLIDKIKEYI
ncbi:(4Fe-4S)-binding protein [Candidatus Thorarchaeota archaeon]|nr:MAG: (4Fe-4S)-binding protein [Candidatus Thorarchaeota archaeon]